MGKVIGLGGIFFKCDDVESTKKWYRDHLGLNTDDYGCTFWQLPLENGTKSSQQWSPFKKNTTYFGSNDQQFMINFKVTGLKDLLTKLKSAGVEIVGDIEHFDYGSFGWIIDCDNRKVELWEPKNEELFENQ